MRCAGFSGNEIKAVVNRSLMAKDEIQAVRLSAKKLRRLTGWKPEILFAKSLKDILDHAEREAV